MLRAAIACGALALCGVGVSHAQDGLFTETQMGEINCVFTGVLDAKEESAVIGTLALSARESTYNVEMLDEKLTPFVDACVAKHHWTDEQAGYARTVGAVGAALTSQVAIAIESGASRDDVSKVMPLADTLSDAARDGLASGARADDDTRAILATEIRDAGLKPAEAAVPELVYVLELAARSREAQLKLGGSLFN